MILSKGVNYMVSTKGRYALRVMIDIAVYSNGEYISLKDIAKREEISLKYLEQVISLLYRAHLVQSLRGNNGGYKLAREAHEITAGEILRAAEGTLSNVSCLASGSFESCPHYPSCSTINFWCGFDKVVNDYVDGVTLAKLRDDYIAKLGNDYYI